MRKWRMESTPSELERLNLTEMLLRRRRQLADFTHDPELRNAIQESIDRIEAQLSALIQK